METSIDPASLIRTPEAVATIAASKEAENDGLRDFLKSHSEEEIDAIVHQLNEVIAPQINCTECGNCCKTLMVNVTREEAENLGTQLHLSIEELKATYLEESQQGQLIMNTIPCHFLAGTSCSIYEHRFTECRGFPHLHRPHFTDRIFGTMMHYDRCPIIFNVVEQLKIKTGYPV